MPAYLHVEVGDFTGYSLRKQNNEAAQRIDSEIGSSGELFKPTIQDKEPDQDHCIK